MEVLRGQERDSPQERPSARPPKCMLHLIIAVTFTLLLSTMLCSHYFRLYHSHVFVFLFQHH